MKISLSTLLSLNGGYVDAAGFLALAGLFTAHVTGNFVTLGAALVLGTSGTIGKLLALPVFCVVVTLVRLIGSALHRRARPEIQPLLALEFLLLTAGCANAIAFGPFADADAWLALLTGMVLVAAMAVQNSLHRLYLTSAPPTTLMTGTTTQIMIDIADLMHGEPGQDRAKTKSHVVRMGASVLAFAVGCAAAALFYAFAGLWCFLAPPLFVFFTLFLEEARET